MNLIGAIYFSASMCFHQHSFSIVSCDYDLISVFFSYTACIELMSKSTLSYDVTSWREITPCNKIDKPLVIYRFTGNVMTSITKLRT